MAKLIVAPRPRGFTLPRPPRRRPPAAPQELADALMGMAWWNHLTRPERLYWLTQAQAAAPADAWAAYRRTAAPTAP